MWKEATNKHGCLLFPLNIHGLLRLCSGIEDLFVMTNLDGDYNNPVFKNLWIFGTYQLGTSIGHYD